MQRTSIYMLALTLCCTSCASQLDTDGIVFEEEGNPPNNANNPTNNANNPTNNANNPTNNANNPTNNANNPTNNTNNPTNNGMCPEVPCGDGDVCQDGQCECDPEQHASDNEDCGCAGPCDEFGLELCEGGQCVCDSDVNQSNDDNCGCEGPCTDGMSCEGGICINRTQYCTDDVCIAASVLVPAGPFVMGPDRQVPMRTVTLTRGFYIHKTEVTQRQYQSMLGSNPSHFSNAGDGPPCGPDCPVENVNWLDAVMYCNALSDYEGLEPCYNAEGEVIGGQNVYECQGWRLPTEAEWEKAARGEDGRVFPWGEQLPDCDFANLSVDENNPGCGNNSTQTVASTPFGQSPYFLSDMAGNVAEWTANWFENEVDQSVDPLGPPDGTVRTLKGGSYLDTGGLLRSGARRISEEDVKTSDVGFRCARSL